MPEPAPSNIKNLAAGIARTFTNKLQTLAPALTSISAAPKVNYIEMTENDFQGDEQTANIIEIKDDNNSHYSPTDQGSFRMNYLIDATKNETDMFQNKLDMLLNELEKYNKISERDETKISERDETKIPERHETKIPERHETKIPNLEERIKRLNIQKKKRSDIFTIKRKNLNGGKLTRKKLKNNKIKNKKRKRKTLKK